MNALRVATLILAVMPLLEQDASAQAVMHRVRFGENLASIAAYYYDDRGLAALLANVNGRTLSDPLRAGDRLRIPTAWAYTVGRRTTVSAVARHLLGDRRRAFALQAFNRLRGQRLRAGTRLIIPFVITHVSDRGDTFVEIAKRYYGDPRRARMVARYNFLTGTGPPLGQELKIPIVRVRITPRRLRELLNARVLGVAPLRDDAREALQEANALLRRGQYWRVPMRLLRMLARDHASDAYTAEIFKLLAIAYVAVDRQDLAVRAFREALLHQPDLKLDPVRDSPKVIRAFVDAQSPEPTPPLDNAPSSSQSD